MMSIFPFGCMLTGKLLNFLMQAVIIPLLKYKSKDPADVNKYRPIAISTALSKVLEQVLLSRLARYLWTVDSQFGFKQAHGTEMAIFALKQTVDFYHNQDTLVYMCFLDANKALLLLLLLKKVGRARLRKSDVHPISPKTPASQYQPIDRKKIKGKRVKDYSRDRAALGQ